jgi:hypothetical protein
MARVRCSQSAVLTSLEGLDCSDSSEFVDPFGEWRHWPLQRQAIPARQVSNSCLSISTGGYERHKQSFRLANKVTPDVADRCECLGSR